MSKLWIDKWRDVTHIHFVCVVKPHLIIILIESFKMTWKILSSQGVGFDQGFFSDILSPSPPSQL